MIETHPSKALKFCPFCGSPHFIWDGTKAHNCQDCKQRLYTNAAGAVIALIENEKKELLFTIRKYNPAKGKLDLPGGFIDIGENAEQAVVREVKEELNLDVDSLFFYKTFPNTYIFKDFMYFTIDIVFRCSVKNIEKLEANDDVEKVIFKNVKEVKISDIGLCSVKNLVSLLRK